MEKLIIKCRNKIKNYYNIATLLIIDNGTFLYIYLNLNYLFLIKPKNIIFWNMATILWITIDFILITYIY